MKNLFKILLGLIGVVILLMVGAAIVLPMIYDTDDLKRRIEAEVTDRTGRE
ncbi:MAG: hypothetical protein GWN54_02175, partial [Gammaproteobacteria bacterium]|nr:hypothetical protein [Gammaproteobacteria bacterium]